MPRSQKRQSDKISDDRSVDSGKKRKMLGRAKSSVSQFIECQKPAEADGYLLQRCIFCDRTKSSKQFQATIWVAHLLRDCAQAPIEVKEQLASESKSKRIENLANGIPNIPRLKQEDDERDYSDEEEVPVNAKPAKRGRGRPKSTGAIKTEETTVTPKRGRPRKSESGTSNQAGATKAQATSSRRSSQDNDSCDANRAEQITMSIMQFVTANSLSIMLVESVYFLRMVKALNEAYYKKHLPKSEVFAKTWLPKLYKSIREKISDQWGTLHGCYHTLCVDAFSNESSPEQNEEVSKNVLLFTEAANGGSFVEFRGVSHLSHGGELTAQDIVRNIDRRLQQREQKDSRDVEDRFCAVTFENLEEGNLAAGKILESKYPKLFINSCRIHCASNICRDILENISEVKQILEDVVFVSNFVCNFTPVKEAFKQKLDAEKAKMLEQPPSNTAVLSNACLAIKNLLGKEDMNVPILTNLINDAHDWGNQQEVSLEKEMPSFFAKVSNADWFRKVKVLHQALSLLDAMVNHLERKDFSPSWLLPLFETLLEDLDAWSSEMDTRLSLEQSTIDEIKEKVVARWKGGEDGEIVGLYDNQYFLATLCDPFFTPALADLPSDWLERVRPILEKFYSKGDDLMSAENEVEVLISQQGTSWGDDVRRRQKSMIDNNPRQDDETGLASLIKKQVFVSKISTHVSWQTKYSFPFPLLAPIAIRILTMATDASAAERSCNVSQILSQTTVQLEENKTLQHLLFCHINLRLLDSVKYEEDMGQFLEQSILAHVVDDSDPPETDPIIDYPLEERDEISV